MNCKNCNAIMQVDVERKLFTCPYCGATETLDSTSKEEIQELLKDALHDANKESRQMMESMIASHRREMELANRDNVGKDVAIYVGLTIAACFTVIMTMFGLSTEYKASGVVALIQSILFISAIIAKASSKRSGDRKGSVVANVCMIAGALLVIVWIIALSVTSESEDKKTYMDEIYERDYYWPDEGYAKVVPRWGDQPDYSYVGDREFSATLLNATDEMYDSYIEQCKKDGFTIDVTATDTTYNAYNELGNELDVDYIRNLEDKVIYVKLYKELEFGNMAWPSQGMMKDVPQPDSDQLMVESMSTDYFKAFVNDVTPEKFLLYVQQCMEIGFDGRYESGSDKFYGAKDNIRLSLELKRGKVMEITVYE